jgi:hypothetical protein
MSDKDLVLSKVKKLLALSECKAASENEAEQALLRAQKLLKDNNLSIGDITDGDKVLFNDINININKKYTDLLMEVISSHFQCEYLTNKRNSVVVSFRLFGYEKSIEICKQAFVFASNFIVKRVSVLKSIAKSNKEPTSEIDNSYAYGFIFGLKAKLDNQSRALLIITPKETTDFYNTYMDDNNIEVIRKVSRVNYDSEYYGKGFSDGNTLKINKEIEK